MNEVQTILPFRQWQISPRWGALLAIVNAWARWSDRYDPIQWHIYGLKDEILTRHGVPDGTDLQIITLHCNACDGRGYFGFQHHETCRKCLGSRVYARDYITLGRFRIGSRVFHVPDAASRFRVLDEDHGKHWRPTGEGHVGVIHGRVQNVPIPRYRWRWLALIALTIRFKPERTGRAFGLVVWKMRRAFRFWWFMGNGSEWRVRWQRASAGLPVNWSGPNEDPSVPF